MDCRTLSNLFSISDSFPWRRWAAEKCIHKMRRLDWHLPWNLNSNLLSVSDSWRQYTRNSATPTYNLAADEWSKTKRNCVHGAEGRRQCVNLRIDFRVWNLVLVKLCSLWDTCFVWKSPSCKTSWWTLMIYMAIHFRSVSCSFCEWVEKTEQMKRGEGADFDAGCVSDALNQLLQQSTAWCGHVLTYAYGLKHLVPVQMTCRQTEIWRPELDSAFKDLNTKDLSHSRTSGDPSRCAL